jgi:hypothetical protein
VVIATASAVHTLSRILTPQPSRAVARSTVSRYSRPAYTQAQTRSGFAARVAMSASRARARAVASYAHSMRTRTHLAAASSRSRVHY